MAYFAKHSVEEPHEPVFQVPLQEEDPFDEEKLPEDLYQEEYPEEPLSDAAFEAREARERHRDRMRLLGGAGDLLGVVVGTLLILGLIWLLVAMVSWTMGDLGHSFQAINSWF